MHFDWDCFKKDEDLLIYKTYILSMGLSIILYTGFFQGSPCFHWRGVYMTFLKSIYQSICSLQSCPDTQIANEANFYTLGLMTDCLPNDITLDQSRGRKTDRGTRRSQRRGEEGATLVTVDQPFRHRTNQNQHPESGCWISLVHIWQVWRNNAQLAVQFAVRSITIKSVNTGLGRGCFNVLRYIVGQCCTNRWQN